MVNDRIAVQERSEERLPVLCGFHVTHDLSVVEVAVHGWPGWTPREELHGVLRAALEDLIDDCAEEAAELMRGRTFARALH